MVASRRILLHGTMPSGGPLPQGLILVWSGLVGDIPSGFSLCNGTNGTPNLVDKFIKSIPDGITNPGSIGGSNSHSHVVTSDTHPASDHGLMRNIGGAGGQSTLMVIANVHDHSGLQTQINVEPPYYKVAFIMVTGIAVSQIPDGVIAIFCSSLSGVPAGWSLFSALYTYFLKGASSNIGLIGGSSSHTHTINSAGAHTHGQLTWYSTFGSSTIIRQPSSAGGHTHSIGTPNHIPLNKTVAFLGKSGAGPISSGIIALWSGTLDTIPPGWALCDGQNGRPNLLNRFVRGIPDGTTDPDVEGGEASHFHTIASGGAHAHSGTGTSNVTDGSIPVQSQYGTGGAHTHGGNSDVVSNDPPYYTLAFIIKV